MNEPIDIAPERVGNRGLEVDPLDTYLVFDPETGEIHTLGHGYQDSLSLLMDAEDVVSGSDFHITTHVVRSVGVPDAETTNKVAKRLENVSDEQIRLTKHPHLNGIDIPEVSEDEIPELNDKELLGVILNEQLRSDQRPSPDPDSVILLARLIEEIESRGYDVDGCGIQEQLINQVFTD